MPRILFYVERSLHLAFLEPVHDYLQGHDLALTAFSAPPYFPGDGEIPGWGLPESETTRLKEKSPFFEHPEEFAPDVTIVADACHFRIPHIKNVINVGHGMICKGAFYTDSPVVRRENLSELLLVPGPWHKRRLKKNVFIPIRCTGFIKSDLLFGPQAMGREEFCARQGIDPKKKIILFAPTYNPELSAIPCLGDKIGDLAGKDKELLIKLHNLTDASWKEQYKDLAESQANIHYLGDTDYSGMMHAADLLISDVSSIFTEFILLDKPVVLMDNPEMKSFAYYQPGEIEYQARSAAKCAKNVSELKKLVDSQLQNRGELSTRRKQFAAALDYGRDGKSAERAATAILDWIEGKIKPDFPRIAAVLLAGGKDFAQKDVLEIKNCSAGFDLQVWTLESPKNSPELPDISRAGSLGDLLERSKADYFLFLPPSHKLLHNALKLLLGHFFWNKEVGAVKAITEREVADQILSALTGEEKRVGDPGAAAFGLMTLGVGQSVEAPGILSQAAMFPRKLLEARKGKDPTPGSVVRGLVAEAEERGLKILLAADCFMQPKAGPQPRNSR